MKGAALRWAGTVARTTTEVADDPKPVATVRPEVLLTLLAIMPSDQVQPTTTDTLRAQRLTAYAAGWVGHSDGV